AEPNLAACRPLRIDARKAHAVAVGIELIDFVRGAPKERLEAAARDTAEVAFNLEVTFTNVRVDGLPLVATKRLDRRPNGDVTVDGGSLVDRALETESEHVRDRTASDASREKFTFLIPLVVAIPTEAPVARQATELVGRIRVRHGRIRPRN